MKKGMPPVQDEQKKVKDNNNDNNNSSDLDRSAEYSTQIRQKLFGYSIRRKLRNLLNDFLTPPNIQPPVSLYKLAKSRPSFLEGNFGVYFAKGERTTMMQQDQDFIAHHAEMPFLSQKHLDIVLKRIAKIPLKKQKYIFFNSLIELADSILEKIMPSTLAPQEFERFLLEIEFFAIQLSKMNNDQYSWDYISSKIDEWFYRFKLDKNFEIVCKAKLEEIQKSFEELKQLAQDSTTASKRNDHLKFTSFKTKKMGFVVSDFSSTVYSNVENFGYENHSLLEHQKDLNQAKDLAAAFKLSKEDDSIYIAEFQKPRLKKAAEKERNVLKWLQSTQRLLVYTLTLEEKRILRTLAKRLLKQKKISPEKVSLGNLTYNFYELLQSSAQYSWISYLLEPSKHFLFFYNRKFLQLFPLSAVIDPNTLQEVELEFANLEGFYTELESFFNHEIETKELAAKVVSRFSQGLNGVNETLENLRTEYFIVESQQLTHAINMISKIQPEKYQAFSQHIESFVKKVFANKSLSQFYDYFEQFKHLMIDYLAPKLSDELEQTTKEHLITVWCQSWVQKYQKMAILEDMFIQSMEHIYVCDAQVEAHKSQELKPKGLQRQNSGSKLPFISTIGRERSKSDQQGPIIPATKKLPLQKPQQTKSSGALPDVPTAEELEPDYYERQHSNTISEYSSTTMRGPGGSGTNS